MTDFHYCMQRHPSGDDGFYDMIRWICDNHPTLTNGPAYTVVEADDGTNRNTPSGAPYSLTELGASNRWNPDNANYPPPTGSWIVLESLDSYNSNHFQVIFQLVGDNLQYRLIPLEDFTTGGASTAPSLPTLPATAFGATSSTSVEVDGFSFSALYHCTATEGNLIIWTDHANDANLTYIGEVDEPDPADDRPYVLYWQTDGVGPYLIANYEDWNRLSPVDDSTIIGYAENQGSQLCAFHDHGEIDYHDPDESGILSLASRNTVLPAYLAFFQTGHRHGAGWLRNLRLSHGAIGKRKASGDLEWVYRNLNFLYPSFAIKWDGSTSYP